MDFCVKHGLGVLTYGSLGGGILTGRMKQPAVGGNELRGAFYGFYDDAGWAKAQKLLAVLQEIADAHGASVAEVSINWVLAQKGATTALLGATTPEMAIENAKAADWGLSADELSKIEFAYQRIIG